MKIFMKKKYMCSHSKTISNLWSYVSVGDYVSWFFSTQRNVCPWQGLHIPDFILPKTTFSSNSFSGRSSNPTFICLSTLQKALNSDSESVPLLHLAINHALHCAFPHYIKLIRINSIFSPLLDVSGQKHYIFTWFYLTYMPPLLV